MINISEDNLFELKQYWVDHYSDGLVKLLVTGEDSRYSFSNGDKTQKVIFSDQRVLIEEKEDSGFAYSFIGYDKIDYLQIKTRDLDRHACGVEVSLVLHTGHTLKFTFTDDVNVCELEGFLSEKIFGITE